MDAVRRLHRVARGAGIDLSVSAEPILSYSNDAWRIGDTVLRICWRGDRERLPRESMLLMALPEVVPHAEVLDEGRVDDLTWMLTRSVEGEVLSEAWSGLDLRARRKTAQQMAETLAALHSWEPPEAVGRVLTARSDGWLLLDEGTDRRRYDDVVDSILGADVNPLPVERALALVEPARKLPGVDPAVVDAAAGRLEELAGFDPFSVDSEHAVVHGDAHLGNMLWQEGGLTALLDFEWARWGPPDLELQPFCRSEEEGHLPQALAWMAFDYPGLVAQSRLVERLWLYDLAAVLRHLLLWPPGDLTEIPSFHPVRRLPEMIKGPSYIERLLEPVTSCGR